MRIVKKLMAGITGMALILSVAGPMKLKAAEGAAVPAADGITASVEITVPDNKVLTYEYTKPQDFVVNITNTGSDTLSDVTLMPKLRSEADTWPFKTEYQSYSGSVKDLAAGETKSVAFSFTERDNVPTARFVLTFAITVNGADGGQKSFYVNTTAKPEDKKPDSNGGGQSDNGETNQAAGGAGSSGLTVGGDMDGAMMADAGGISNGGASYLGGGGSSSGSNSVPRVIVTGFTTDPAQVKAGSNFNLTIHLKNTAKSTKVSNMLFDLSAPTEGTDEQTSAPAFLPSSGANSIYLDGIAADGTADISIQLNAKADLVQKPYGINLSMKYEDGNAAQVEAASSISIPVKQDARFELSEFELTPEEIAVGEEVNAACSLYNLGRIKLYNVKAVFEGSCIKKEEIFIGNVEPGATASIDAMVEGKTVTSGPAKIKMTLNYEDEAGRASKMEKELKLSVTEAGQDDAAMAAGADMMEEQKGFPVVPVAIGTVAAAGVVTAILWHRKKKKRLLSTEEEGLLDEVDRPSEDEQRES